MGAARQGLRVLRLVLLGGALAVLWVLLTAAGSSAAPGQGDDSLPVLAEAPVVRDVLDAAPDDDPAPEADETSIEGRKPLPSKPARLTTETVERAVPQTVPEVVAVTHTTLRATEAPSSAVVDEVARVTEGLPVAPVVTPIVDPVVDVVVTVVDVVPDPGEVVAPQPQPAGDAVLPTVSASAVEAPAPTEASRAAGSPGATAAARAVAAPTGGSRATAAQPALTVAQETISTAAASQGAARGSHRSSLPTGPVPLGHVSSGCVPGAASGGGGPLDQAADRSTALLQAPAERATCTAGHQRSVPGPSALPGFSPE